MSNFTKLNLELVNLVSLVMPEMGRGTYRGTSVTRNSAFLGSYMSNMPRAEWWSLGGGAVSMREESLYGDDVHVVVR